MYFAAAKLPAGLLAVVVNTVPVLTYIIALALHEEEFSLLRLLGVLTCIAGIMLLVIPSTSLPFKSTVPWILSALITPFCFSLCAVYTAKYRPKDSNPLTLSAGMLCASSLLLTPLIIATGHFYPLWPPLKTQGWLILLEILLSSIGYLLFFQLLKIAGAVYYSLVGGIVALTGLAWGWLLFNEKLNTLSGAAIALIIAGIFLVTLWRKVK